MSPHGGLKKKYPHNGGAQAVELEDDLVTLFSFATQATERVPGASIEKPRGWVLNLAAF